MANELNSHISNYYDSYLIAGTWCIVVNRGIGKSIGKNIGDIF